MTANSSTVAGMRIDSIINPATGEPVKISDAAAEAAVGNDFNSFIAGYQHRLADEWTDRHVKLQRATLRDYTIYLRNGEPAISLTAASHGDRGEWVVFFDADDKALVFIKQADIISIWRDPIETT